MKEILKMLIELNEVSICARTILAMVLGGVLGFQREQLKRGAGFRTFIIVCVGSALVTMTSIYMQEGGLAADASRIPAQIISGMGFLGAGTILVTRNTRIKGLTTAASLWTTACLGIAVGAGFYLGAIVGTVSIVVSLGVLKAIEDKMDEKSGVCQLYVEVTDGTAMRKIIQLSKRNDIKIYDLEIISLDGGAAKRNAITLYTRKKEKNANMEVFLEELEKIDVVEYVEQL